MCGDVSDCSLSKWQRDQICVESKPFTLRVRARAGGLQMICYSQPTRFSFQLYFNITSLLFSCSSTTHYEASWVLNHQTLSTLQTSNAMWRFSQPSLCMYFTCTVCATDMNSSCLLKSYYYYANVKLYKN